MKSAKSELKCKHNIKEDVKLDMLKLSKNTVMMLLNATEDTQTLLHQGKGNTDASRTHMKFLCTVKSTILCLAEHDCQITDGLPRISYLKEGAFLDSLEQQRNNIPMQAYPCSFPAHESILMYSGIRWFRILQKSKT